MGIAQTSGKKARKIGIPFIKMEQNSLKIFLLAITKTPYDLRQYQSHRSMGESEKYVPNVHDNSHNISRA